MTGSRTGHCEWCNQDFIAAGTGPLGRYCSAAHRQAAHRARHAGTRRVAGPVTDPELDNRLDELARLLSTPGDASQLALWAVAADVVAATGRPVPDDIEVTTPLGETLGRRRASRPAQWQGRRIPRPAAGGLDRVYQRAWDREHGCFQVTVRTIRADRPIGTAKPLWLRRHRASDHRDWRQAYDWTDPFDVPDSRGIYALGADLVADATDHHSATLGQWHDPWYLVRHFNGDVLWRIGDTAWTLRRSEILNWLDLHGYLETVT